MTAVQEFLRSLLTKHLLAKFISVFIAIVTVSLIDRDIGSVTNWEEKRIPVFVVRGNVIPPSRGIRILVDADPLVWMDEVPKSLKVKISGPKNRRDDFMEDPVIRIHVREEQVPDLRQGGVVPRITLDTSELKTKIEKVQVLLLEKLSIGVDMLIEKKNQNIELGTIEGLPANRVVDLQQTTLTPPTVDVIGPRHAFAGTEGVKILTVVPVNKTGLRDGVSYPLEIKEGTGFVRFLDETAVPQMNLVLKRPEPVTIDLGEMEIFWALTEDVRNQLVDGRVTMVKTLTYDQTKVKISGPPHMLDPYRDDVEKLRKLIRVVADPNKQLGENLQGKKVVNIPLIALGVPPGLEVQVEPAIVPLTISRKNSDND